MDESKREKLRKLPAVDLLIKEMQKNKKFTEYPHSIMRESARQVLEQFRDKILSSDQNLEQGIDISFEKVLLEAGSCLKQAMQPSLKKVINATGTVLHTNLGRAPLAESALASIISTSRGYSNLEYELETGQRGERYSHVEKLLCDLTGAEASLVVNNNAAAVMLVLGTIAKGKEVIVPRGELVEIGGSFRIPAVIEQSGARLVEVGATNKTHLQDYKEAITAKTGALLKVHTSNYRIVGFFKEVSLPDLVSLGEEFSLPVIEDLGSGVLVNLPARGFDDEPTVKEKVKSGATLITFSGDKLLGGPQAGIIVGKKRYIDMLKRNQLTRALRIDKLTLAALEATLRLYLKGEDSIKEIPVLNMLLNSEKELKEKASVLAESLANLKEIDQVELLQGFSKVGGGAMPLAELATWLVELKLSSLVSIDKMEKLLRNGTPPLIIRVQKDKILLDPRTLYDRDLEIIPEIFKNAFSTYRQGGL